MRENGFIQTEQEDNDSKVGQKKLLMITTSWANFGSKMGIVPSNLGRVIL
jgi:hypothetical protein